MAHDEIPRMMGKVLSGTNYGLKQTRGKFGLGAKMALIWSKMSTGLPILVKSAKFDNRSGHVGKISHYKLDIDLKRNEPNVKSSKQFCNRANWHGAEVTVTIEGNLSSYKRNVLTYLSLLAVITPYAYIGLQYTSRKNSKDDFEIAFHRRTQVIRALRCSCLAFLYAIHMNLRECVCAC